MSIDTKAYAETALTNRLAAVNDYINKHCVCDGMGPLDSIMDEGRFEGLSKEDLNNIIRILNDHA